MMLRSENEFVLSQQTMVAAMQHYLDTVLLKKAGDGKVVRVEASERNNYHGQNSFKVVVAESTPEVAAPSGVVA